MHAAREIESDPAAFTRRALIYAIAPAGHATLLTAALILKTAFPQTERMTRCPA